MWRIIVEDRLEVVHRIAVAEPCGQGEGSLDVVIVFRWAERVDQLSELAAELVRMKVSVIFATSSTMVEPARQATQIPIVFATHADPVGVGHVASLARPGGNITGLTVLLTDTVGKELEILKDAVPQATRIGVLCRRHPRTRSPCQRSRWPE